MESKRNRMKYREKESGIVGIWNEDCIQINKLNQ